jgi:hypothetical protein
VHGVNGADAAMRGRRWTRPAALWLLLIAVGFAGAFTNALRYSDHVASPVATADAWYFIDVFVAKDVEQGWGWADLFVKRGGTDHAQPLNKLIMSYHTHRLGLDFWVEGLIGVLGGALFVLGLLWFALRQLGASAIGFRQALPLALLPVAFFSLNSTHLYSWSLVTLAFLVLPVLLACYVVATMKPTRSSLALMFAASLAAFLTQDNAIILGLAALVAAVMLRGVMQRRLPSAAWHLLPLLLAFAMFKLNALMVGHGALGGGSGGMLAGLWRELPNAWMWAVVPAASSVVHAVHLESIAGTAGALPATIAVGIAVLTLHAWFWVSALRRLPHSNGSFVAVCLMLSAYAFAAGVVLSRVPEFGSDYLYQPRYVLFYQLATVALLLQLAFAWKAPAATADLDTEAVRQSHIPRGRGHVLDAAIVAGLVGFLALQYSLSISAWDNAKYIRHYTQGMAATLHCLAAHPDESAPVCQPWLAICDEPLERRNRLVGFLQSNELNVFSPQVQQRHGLHADPGQIAVCVAPVAQEPVAQEGDPALLAR